MAVSLDPWHTIAAVHWGDEGVVIVQVTAPETKSYQVAVLQPDDWDEGSFGGSTIVFDDYKESFVLDLGSAFGTGTVVTEDEIHPWIWDGFFTGAIGDEPFNSSQVAIGTATFGYAPPLHLTGEQVQRNQLNPPFGTHDLGDVVVHTHPNGSIVRYRNGYTAITHGPVGEPPVGDVDFSGTESWYWYRETTVAEETAAILRRSFLVNFRSHFVTLAELRDSTSALDSPLEWSISGYPARTGFSIAEAIVTPLAGAAARFSDSGSVAGAHSGTIRKFSGAGFRS